VSNLRVAVVGASGRMGRSIVRLALQAGDVVVACAVGNTDVGRDAGELAGAGTIGVKVTADPAAIASCGAPVVIDFSSPALTPIIAVQASHAKAALVCGTTGLDEQGKRALDGAAREVPVLWEPNMSVGVQVLGELLRRAVAALGPAFDVEIVETHHRLKVDAPSGTALKLAQIARDAKAQESKLVHGREARPGARGSSEIGVFAVRGGDVVGDHAVHLLGAGERLELVHRATNRDVFAHGALTAARFLAGKPPGRYTLADVIAGG
jgi:4-hydroxy-tetrahydrodipicolinate reductase